MKDVRKGHKMYAQEHATTECKPEACAQPN